MKLFFSLVALSPFAFAASSAVSEEQVTVTVRRTITTCPCDGRHSTSWTFPSTHPDSSVVSSTTTSAATTTSTVSDLISTNPTSALTTKASTSSAITTTPLTSASASASTTTSSILSTTTSTAPGKVDNPGVAFIPSGQISTARLAKRSTVYFDLSNPNAAYLTTDRTKATAFTIDNTGALSTTIDSYYSQCGGGESPSGDPGRFSCSDSGAIPATFRGWTNDPTFTYKNWIFCHKADLSVYMSSHGPTSDCTAVVFTSGSAGVPSGNS